MIARATKRGVLSCSCLQGGRAKGRVRRTLRGPAICPRSGRSYENVCLRSRASLGCTGTRDRWTRWSRGPGRGASYLLLCLSSSVLKTSCVDSLFCLSSCFSGCWIYVIMERLQCVSLAFSGTVREVQRARKGCIQWRKKREEESRPPTSTRGPKLSASRRSRDPKTGEGRH